MRLIYREGRQGREWFSVEHNETLYQCPQLTSVSCFLLVRGKVFQKLRIPGLTTSRWKIYPTVLVQPYLSTVIRRGISYALLSQMLKLCSWLWQSLVSLNLSPITAQIDIWCAHLHIFTIYALLPSWTIRVSAIQSRSSLKSFRLSFAVSFDIVPSKLRRSVINLSVPPFPTLNFVPVFNCFLIFPHW